MATAEAEASARDEWQAGGASKPGSMYATSKQGNLASCNAPGSRR